MKQKKKKIASLVLCLVLILGISSTVFAGSGNISYGGTTAKWDISKRNFKSTISYKASATLQMKITLNIGTYYTPYIYVYTDNNTTVTQTTYTRTVNLGMSDYFISSNNNKIEYYVNNKLFNKVCPKP